WKVGSKPRSLPGRGLADLTRTAFPSGANVKSRSPPGYSPRASPLRASSSATRVRVPSRRASPTRLPPGPKWGLVNWPANPATPPAALAVAGRPARPPPHARLGDQPLTVGRQVRHPQGHVRPHLPAGGRVEDRVGGGGRLAQGRPAVGGHGEHAGEGERTVLG